jgi:LmbE family N-acetylglucosaminyl deacetylase
MLPLLLTARPGQPLHVLAIGAHPDDIELGAGGTLLSLAESLPGLRVHYVVMTGTPTRHEEARQAAAAFLPGAKVTLDLLDLPEGRLPAAWRDVKDAIERTADGYSPDLILAPAPGDAHQDHRTIAEIVPTAFRDHLYLGYEVPKWDGDLGRPGLYFPLTAATVQRKARLLHASFPSQHGRDWWDDDVFLGLARLRGMECRAPYAEAFGSAKCVLRLDS